MHKGRSLALAAAAGGLAAAFVAAAGGLAPSATARPAQAAGQASTASTGGKTGTAAPRARGRAVRPGVIQFGAGLTSVPNTAACVKTLAVACYWPSQLQAAYDEGPLFKRGIEGKGQTIVIVDSFGSPTIASDLSVFDKQFKLPAPPSFTIIRPDRQRVPTWKAENSDMTGWGAETTLDVEWAHAIAPEASITLVETPVSETEGIQGFPQIVEAEDYVIKHHLGA